MILFRRRTEYMRHAKNSTRHLLLQLQVWTSRPPVRSLQPDDTVSILLPRRQRQWGDGRLDE